MFRVPLSEHGLSLDTFRGLLLGISLITHDLSLATRAAVRLRVKVRAEIQHSQVTAGPIRMAAY